MTSIYDDTEAQLYMMRDAYLKLREIDPEHELFELATIHDDTMGFDFSKKYRKRCVRNTDRYRVQGYARYTFALEAATRGEPIKLLDTDPP